jgi:hemolysin III
MNPSARPIKVSWNYNRAEIIADTIVHAVGGALSIAGAAVLLAIAFRSAPGAEITSVIVYVIGLLAMLGLSMAYNLWPVSPRKWLLRRFDHSSIYLLIAGTYTPFIWQMKSEIVPILLVVVWLTAAAGITLKLFWPGRF